MDSRVSLPVAKNAMVLLRDGAASSAFEAMGISDEDFRIATSAEPYVGLDRGRVSATLESLCHGTLDVVGLPRIEVPIEFRAAVIAMFVHPGNVGVACRWMEAGESSFDTIQGGSVEPCTAKQLFALVLSLTEEGQHAKREWTKRTGRAVRLVEEMNDGKVQK